MVRPSGSSGSNDSRTRQPSWPHPPSGGSCGLLRRLRTSIAVRPLIRSSVPFRGRLRHRRRTVLRPGAVVRKWFSEDSRGLFGAPSQAFTSVPTAPPEAGQRCEKPDQLIPGPACDQSVGSTHEPRGPTRPAAAEGRRRGFLNPLPRGLIASSVSLSGPFRGPFEPLSGTRST